MLIRIVKIVPIEDLKGLIDRFAKTFGKSKGRISQLVGAEIDRRKMSRDSIAYKFNLLGWTHEEIGEVLKLDRSTVTGIVAKFNIKLFDEEFKRGDKVEDISKHNQTDQATTWARRSHPAPSGRGSFLTFIKNPKNQNPLLSTLYP